MKHTVRAFSVGLIVAGLILLGVFYFDGVNEGHAEYTTEELIEQVEADGFRVITEEEYISFSVANSQQSNDSQAEDEEEDEIKKEVTEKKVASKTTESKTDNTKAPKEKEEEKEKDKDNTPSTFTIQIESGMASSQISRLLEERGIVDDAEAFNSYLLEHDYSLRVQLGEHELQTGMSYYEIAERLTN